MSGNRFLMRDSTSRTPAATCSIRSPGLRGKRRWKAPRRSRSLRHLNGSGRQRIAAMLRKPMIVVEFREILEAAVGKHGDDDRLSIEPLRELHARPDIGSGAAARENALLAREPPRRAERILIREGHHFVDHAEIHAGDEMILADALHLILFLVGGIERSGAEIRAVDRAGGIRHHHLDGGIALLEIATRTRDGAAGAAGGHEIIDPAAALLPDLRAGAEVMRLGIVGIVVLID